MISWLFISYDFSSVGHCSSVTVVLQARWNARYGFTASRFTRTDTACSHGQRASRSCSDVRTGSELWFVSLKMMNVTSDKTKKYVHRIGTVLNCFGIGISSTQQYTRLLSCRSHPAYQCVRSAPPPVAQWCVCSAYAPV